MMGWKRVSSKSDISLIIRWKLLRNPLLLVARKISPNTHASRYSVPVEHARGELVARGPSVAVGVRAALVRFPEIPVLAAHVPLHGPAHDLITHVLKFLQAHSQVRLADTRHIRSKFG